MNETRLARQQLANTNERPQPAFEPAANEIRVLDELELMLAGGGDLIDGWP